MELLQWIASSMPGMTSADSLPLLLDTASGGTGIDAATFWLVLSGLGSTITALASLLYKGERDRRIAAETKLEKFQELAPDLASNVQWLVEEASQRDPGREMPWPVRRSSPARSPMRPTARRRPR